MKDTVVFDLDGTLANIDHRLHFVKRDKPDFDSFFKACVDDTPNEWCDAMLNAFSEVGYRVLIVSARSKVVEKETRAWLLAHLGISNDADLIMLREEGNHRPDDYLKIEWLRNSGLKDRILCVVDDRQRVVDMWRKEGLVCLQCYAWDEFKKEPPHA